METRGASTRPPESLSPPKDAYRTTEGDIGEAHAPRTPWNLVSVHRGDLCVPAPCVPRTVRPRSVGASRRRGDRRGCCRPCPPPPWPPRARAPHPPSPREAAVGTGAGGGAT